MNKRIPALLIITIMLFALLPQTALAAEDWTEVGNLPGGPYHSFYSPGKLVFDASGKFYVVDRGYNRIIRYTSSSGELDLSWGGDGVVGGSKDGGSGADEFYWPDGIAIDPSSGCVYIADTSNHRVKRYTSEGVLDTSWGGGDGMIGAYGLGNGPYEFLEPRGLAVDESGNLYVALLFGIRRFTEDGVIDTTWAGDGRVGSPEAGEGGLNTLLDLALDAAGNLYVTDIANNFIKRFTEDGVIDTTWGGGDGTIGSEGSGAEQLDGPDGITVDAAGFLYVADSANDRIKRYTSEGELDTSWCDGGMLLGEGRYPEKLYSPKDVAVDLADNLYVSNGSPLINRYTPDGKLDTGWAQYGTLGAIGSDADRFCGTGGITFDSGGNVYISDTGNNRIKRYTPLGELDTSWCSDGMLENDFDQPRGIATDASGGLYVADYANNQIKKFKDTSTLDVSWAVDGIIDGTDEFNRPESIAADAQGNLYVADYSNNRVKRYTSAGVLDTSWCAGGVLGGGSAGSGPDEFDSPYLVATDASGNLYVYDAGNVRIKRYTPLGQLDTSWCTGGILARTYGYGTDKFRGIYGIAADEYGNVYVADRSNRHIKRYTPDDELDTGWFSGGVYAPPQTLEGSEDYPIQAQSVACNEGRVYSGWSDRVIILGESATENEARLSDLSVSGKTVNGFDPDTREYSIVVSSSAKEIDISAKALSLYAAVSGTGKFSLGSGNSAFTVAVTSGSGQKKDYTVNVLRSSDGAGLTGISVDGAAVDGFSSSKTSYTVTAPYGREYVSISATGNSFCEEVVGAGVVKLSGDSTDFSVIAKADDGGAKEYTLTVKKGSLEETTYDILLDSKLLGASGLSFTVRNDGRRTIILKIELSDGTVAEYPIRLFSKESTDSAETEEEIPDTGDVSADTPAVNDGAADSADDSPGMAEDVNRDAVNVTMPPEPVFAWWWIAIGVLALALGGAGVWIFILKRR